MAELEKTIEDRLIEQLTEGKSQWTYRPDLHTEEELWANLRSILERGNKAVLEGKPLTDQEFEQVKNQLSFATFYDAAKWIAGENGIAHVYVQRDTETVQLTAREYQILEYLMKNMNAVLSSSQIYEAVWNEASFGIEKTVTVHIRNIREKIEINPKEPKYLKVVYGLGYKIQKY